MSITQEVHVVGRSDMCDYTNVRAEVLVHEKLHATHTKLSTWGIELTLFTGYDVQVSHMHGVDSEHVVISGQGEYELGAVIQALERTLSNLQCLRYPEKFTNNVGELDMSFIDEVKK